MGVSVPSGKYRIKNVKAKGHGLDRVTGKDRAYATSGATDRWEIKTDEGGDYCTITWVGQGTPARLIDLFHQDETIGNQIIIHPENGSRAQQWQIKETAEGSEKHQILYNANEDLAIAVKAAEGDSIALVIVDAKSNDTKQQWVFELDD